MKKLQTILNQIILNRRLCDGNARLDRLRLRMFCKIYIYSSFIKFLLLLYIPSIRIARPPR